MTTARPATEGANPPWGRWALWVALCAVSGGGCQRLTIPRAPGPAPTPDVDVPTVELLMPPVVIEPPWKEEEALEPDPILSSPWAWKPGFRAEVDRWVDFWTEQERDWFPVYLQRMSAYEWMVDQVLIARGLPHSLRFLPIIESGYSAGAVSRAAAVGMWQLMAPTARAGGLEVGAIVDERRDPVRSTETAVEYLAELHERFDSWFLALAAYNGGPSRVERLIQRHAPGLPLSDALFEVIRPYLPRETRDFVPRFIAAAQIALDPDDHGVRTRPPQPQYTYDEVTVPTATSLDVVAWAAGVPEPSVEALNPHILRGVTRNAPTRLKVPAGSGRRFDIQYPLVPPEERVTVMEHVVTDGETLWGIARRYGIELSALQEANPQVRAERLRPGDRLLVPVVQTPRSAVAVGGD